MSQASKFNSSKSIHEATTLRAPASGDAPASNPEQPEPKTPFRLEGYEIIEEVHRGGQGVVYRAVKLSTGREVAIKVTRAGALATENDRARFDREARILGHLEHPNIVGIHDSGEVDGVNYFVMNYIAGRTLDHWAVDQGFPPLQMGLAPAPPTRHSRSGVTRRDTIDKLLELIATVCDAVHAAHQRGVVHRDLKPSNIRVDAAGAPHVLDFGVAKVLHPDPTDAAGAQTLTNEGEFVGSLPWAAPEQADPKLHAIGPHTDVYALGLILYQALTGRFPYMLSGGLRDILERIVTSEPIAPRQWGTNPDVDDEIETIILTCLAKAPERRYSSARAIAVDLRRKLAGEPILAKRDSRFYVARTRVRNWIRARPFSSRLAVALAATAFAQVLFAPLLYRWTQATRMYEQSALSASPPPEVGEFQHVRMVALTEATPIAKIAQQEGLQGVDPRILKSLRRLHGRFMQRLVAAEPRSVTFDLRFTGESEFDEDFCAGARALRAAGVDVVVGAPNWSVDENGHPEICPAIRKEVRWGNVMVDFGETSPWALELAAERVGRHALSAISLETVAAFRNPKTASNVAIEPTANRVRLGYLNTNGRGWVGNDDLIPVYACETESGPTESGDLDRGDLVAFLRVIVPSDAILRNAIIDYAAVMSADEPTLKQWFGGRAVIVGDFREASGDLHLHPDGRVLAGCVGQASGVEQILRGGVLFAPTVAQQWLLTFTAAAIGLLAAAQRFGTIAQIAMAVALAIAWAIAGMAALILFRYLFSPFVPIGAAWVSQAIGVRMSREPPRAAKRPPEIVT